MNTNYVFVIESGQFEGEDVAFNAASLDEAIARAIQHAETIRSAVRLVGTRTLAGFVPIIPVSELPEYLRLVVEEQNARRAKVRIRKCATRYDTCVGPDREVGQHQFRCHKCSGKRAA